MRKGLAIVTGGAMGIGKAIVKELTPFYETVLIADIAEEAGKKTAEELSSDDCWVKYCCCDLTKDESVEKLFDEIEKEYGSIDSLVCNAGIQIRHWATDDNGCRRTR